jgi:hypothetical protein
VTFTGAAAMTVAAARAANTASLCHRPGSTTTGQVGARGAAA